MAKCAKLGKHTLSELWPVLESTGQIPASERAVIQELARVAPELEVWLARYRFGQLIVDRGEFRPPCPGGCVTCTEVKLTNVTIPLALVLDRCAEVFTESERSRIHDPSVAATAPLRMLRAGEWFGVFEMLDSLEGEVSYSKWSVSAGARSMVVLAPPLGDSRLGRALGLSRNTDLMNDPWHLYRRVAETEKLAWEMNVLVFPVIGDRGLQAREFLLRIYRESHRQMMHMRTIQHGGEPSPAEFERALGPVSQVNRHFVRASITHLLAIARGQLPAFEPGERSEVEGAPYQEVAEVLRSGQQQWAKLLRNSVPPIPLQATHLKGQDVGYYSVSQPTLSYVRHKVRNMYDVLEQELLPALENLQSEVLRGIKFYYPSGNVKRQIRALHCTSTLDLSEMVAAGREAQAAQIIQKLRVSKHPWLVGLVRVERP